MKTYATTRTSTNQLSTLLQYFHSPKMAQLNIVLGAGNNYAINYEQIK